MTTKTPYRPLCERCEWNTLEPVYELWGGRCGYECSHCQHTVVLDGFLPKGPTLPEEFYLC